MEKLLQILDDIQTLDPVLKRYLLYAIVRLQVSKKTLLLEEGQIPESISFIEKGVVRVFRHLKGEDKTLWLARESDLFLSSGFCRQSPATQSIETLEDSIFYSISFQDLDYAYTHFPQLNLHGHTITVKLIEISEERKYMLERPAFEKFKFLMDSQSDLIGRIDDKYLASYLELTPDAFTYQQNKYRNRYA